MSAKHVTPERIISAHESCVPEPHEVGADELALDRHHVAHQPHVERRSSARPRSSVIGDVRVRVHEAGQDHLPRAIDPLPRLPLVQPLPDGDDAVTGDGD